MPTPYKLEEVMESLGANLRRLRLEQDLTQVQFAERTGLALRYLMAVEYGHRAPSLAVLVAIANALDAAIDQFFIPAKRIRAPRGRPKRQKVS